MDSSILYIQKGNRSSIVHYVNHQVKETLVLPEEYLNNLCLKELTTLKGRIYAIKKNYHIIKNVPIYIKQDLVFFATNNVKTLDNIYINSVYVKSIEEIKEKCKIIFYDNQSILVNNSYQIIRRKYEKCIKIKNQICQYN